MDRPLFTPAKPRLKRQDLLDKLVRLADAHAGEQYPEREEPLMKYAEQVPLALMLPARDLMRGPGQQHFDRPETWTGLAGDITERGILSPIFLEWSTADGYAYAGEGNTRLAIAEQAGLPTVPVVVYRKSLPLQGQSRGGEIGPFEFNKRQWLLDSGMTEDMPSWEFKMTDGYVPQYFQPHYLIGFLDQRTAARDDQFLSQLTFEWEDMDGPSGTLVARLGDEIVGVLDIQNYRIWQLEVPDEQYRRRGLATEMYNRALEEFGGDVAHGDLTDDGKAWLEATEPDAWEYTKEDVYGDEAFDEDDTNYWQVYPKTSGRLDLPDKYRDEDEWYPYTPGLSAGQLATLGPFYHGTYSENVPSIMQHGLMPRNMVPAGAQLTQWDESVMPVPGRVYLKTESRPYEVYGPETVLQIDPSKLDPSKFRVDEDLANEFGDDVWGSMGAGDPSKGYSTIAYEGTIPPEAISIHRQYDEDGNEMERTASGDWDEKDLFNGKKWWEDPEIAKWQQGYCDTYACALLNTYPHLRMGVMFEPQGDPDDPDTDWWEQHWFAHDDDYAYDSLGRHPLPYAGVRDDLGWEAELDQDPSNWFFKKKDDWGDEYWHPDNGDENDLLEARELIYKQHPWLRERTAANDDDLWEEAFQEQPTPGEQIMRDPPHPFIYSPEQGWIRWGGPNSLHQQIENDLAMDGERVPQDAFYGRYFPGDDNPIVVYDARFTQLPWSEQRRYRDLISLNWPGRK